MEKKYNEGHSYESRLDGITVMLGVFCLVFLGFILVSSYLKAPDGELDYSPQVVVSGPEGLGVDSFIDQGVCADFCDSGVELEVDALALKDEIDAIPTEILGDPPLRYPSQEEISTAPPEEDVDLFEEGLIDDAAWEQLGGFCGCEIACCAEYGAYDLDNATGCDQCVEH